MEAAQHSEEMHQKNKLTKVQQYKWTIRDEPGELMLIDKRELIIDHSYQRDEHTDAKILSFASAWSWVACGAIVVALRDDGFYVMDGQNRVAAARRRSDIAKLPCIVFESQGVAFEAQSFYRINTTKTAVKWVDKLRALAVSGDQVARQVTEMIESAGRRPGSSPSATSVACIATIYKAMQTSPQIVRRLWPLIVGVHRGFPMQDRTVTALLYIEKRLPQGKSVTDQAYRKRLEKLGPNGLIDAINRAAGFYVKGGEKVWAMAVLDLLNRGMRNKLVIEVDDEAKADERP